MALSHSEEDSVRTTAIEMFGEDMVRDLDRAFMEFHDLRLSCAEKLDMANYEFLLKIREKYPDIAVVVIAACLYGMKIGELGREYAYRQERIVREEKPLPKYGHAQ